MRSWTIQCGPFAEHTVKVAKNYTLGKIVTLLVDGEVFVESDASEVDCKGNAWQCNFRFVGERALDFQVFKTNKDGAALDTTDTVPVLTKYMHRCSVIVPNDRDLTTATFYIDGKEFRELPLMRLSHQEPGLSITPTAMLNSHGIKVPYSVDYTAPSNLENLTKHILTRAQTQAQSSQKVASGLFTWCCNSAVGARAVEAIPAEGLESCALTLVEQPNEAYI
jgi:hypothetical protein